jgi:hypothetical protein
MNSKYLYANYIESGITKNARFNLKHILNRDHSNYPYWLLREKLKSYGILLNTPDLNKNKPVIFELHLNAIVKSNSALKYVLLFENPNILPINGRMDLLESYRLVFTWDDNLVDDKRYIKINFSNKSLLFNSAGWLQRTKLLCVIAGNNPLNIKDPNNLYYERVRIIKWFEKYAPNDFDLYGSGWNIPTVNVGCLGRITKVLCKFIIKFFVFKPYPSFKGRVKNKYETLSRYKFTLCYENVADSSGYITEKIFDAFFSGSIPIYRGAINIKKYIPQSCYINANNFKDIESLYSFIAKMNESDFTWRQSEIKRFLSSDDAKPFYADNFAEVVTERIVMDLRGLGFF